MDWVREEAGLRDCGPVGLAEREGFRGRAGGLEPSTFSSLDQVEAMP